MLEDDRLNAVLSTLPTIALEGIAFRSVLERFANEPLSAIGSQLVGGRYNLRGEFEALYLANSEQTALQEVRVLFETSQGLVAISGPPRVIFSVEYSFNAVLDITNPEIENNLGTNFQELTGLWEPMQRQHQLAPTQRLGAAVYRQL
ncbi:MAG: RES family NAD+ phosphorylase [Hormoscilla sp. SP5CHS1]|nr:RES family NAD+ phosphorylase [Hormoscilla sp. SP5CHS1]